MAAGAWIIASAIRRETNSRNILAATWEELPTDATGTAEPVTRPALVMREVFENRAVGATVPMAASCQLLQGAAHRLQFNFLSLEFLRTRTGKRLDVGTRAAPILPQREQLADLLDGKAEIPRLSNEAERVDVPLVIVPVA